MWIRSAGESLDGRYHQRKHRRDCTARIDFPHFGCQGAVDSRFRVGDRRIAMRIARNVINRLPEYLLEDAPWSLKTPILNAAFWRTNESCKSSLHIWPNRNQNSWTG